MLVKFAKASREFSMFTDYWLYCQKYWGVEKDNETYWEEAVEEGHKFHEKYKDIPLSSHLVVAYMNSLEDRSKSDKKNA